MRSESLTVGTVLRQHVAARGEHTLLVCYKPSGLSWMSPTAGRRNWQRSDHHLISGKVTHIGAALPQLRGGGVRPRMLAEAPSGLCATFIQLRHLRRRITTSNSPRATKTEILLATASFPRTTTAAVLPPCRDLPRCCSTSLIDSDPATWLRTLLEAMEHETVERRKNSLDHRYTVGIDERPPGRCAHCHASLLGHQKISHTTSAASRDDSLSVKLTVLS